MMNGAGPSSSASFPPNDPHESPSFVEETSRQRLLVSETLFNEFAEKRKVRHRSSLSIPRSWSFWRLKSEDGSKTMLPQPDTNHEVPHVPAGSRSSDSESRASEPKLRRKSSFKQLMDKFRQYKSTENLDERKRRPHRPEGNGEPAVQYVEEVPGRLVVPVTGLQNHGNSCYINATLQCLNNTAQIYEFFISGQFRKDLAKRNRENAKKFGTNGELTEACGGLVQSLGRGSYVPEISSALIGTVSRFWPQFHDGGEQDAQEFLTWLLDRIHEDLNRKRRKKLKLKKRRKADDRLAGMTESAWGSSFISRLYRGLFRSSLTCKQCGQQSNTFDPFMCLSVPLPQVDMRPFFVHVVFFDLQSRLSKYGFSTSVDCSVRDIKELVAEKTGIDSEEMVVLELGAFGYEKTMSNTQGFGGCDVDTSETTGDIFIVEIPGKSHSTSSEEEEHLFVMTMHLVRLDKDKVQRLSGPRVIQVPRETTYKGLRDCILNNLDPNNNLPAASTPPFSMRLVEHDSHLDSHLDHPLYAETVDECLSFTNPSQGPRHLKLYVEWDVQSADLIERLLKQRVVDDVSVASVKNLPESAKKTGLEDCLDLLMQEEKVGMDESDNSWECPSCGGRQIGTVKRGTLWTLPDIMVIHLKRFRQSATTRFKLTSMVDFPLRHLDMARYLTKDEDLANGTGKHERSNSYSTLQRRNSWMPWQKPRRPPDSQLHNIHTYSLFGVVNHHGRLNSGHYTSFCRHPADGAWYLYDDLKVKTVENPSTEVVTKDAYLLFYQREPLETHPNLYYNDYSQNASAVGTPTTGYKLRPPVLRQSRSTEDISDATLNGEANSESVPKELSRTLHYASLPRYTRHGRPGPPTVHKPPGAHENEPVSPTRLSSNGHASDVPESPEYSKRDGASAVRQPVSVPRSASSPTTSHVTQYGQPKYSANRPVIHSHSHENGHAEEESTGREPVGHGSRPTSASNPRTETPPRGPLGSRQETYQPRSAWLGVDHNRSSSASPYRDVSSKSPSYSYTNSAVPRQSSVELRSDDASKMHNYGRPFSYGMLNGHSRINECENKFLTGDTAGGLNGISVYDDGLPPRPHRSSSVQPVFPLDSKGKMSPRETEYVYQRHPSRDNSTLQSVGNYQNGVSNGDMDEKRKPSQSQQYYQRLPVHESCV